MKPTFFVRLNKGKMTDCIGDCFNAFDDVNSIVRGNVFIKINATIPQASAITDPCVILSTITGLSEAKHQPNNSRVGRTPLADIKRQSYGVRQKS